MDYSLTNIADFERHFQEAELDFSCFENATVQNPDYVIFQIGENVIDEQLSTTELENLFVERYSNVAKHFVSAKKNMLVTQVAINSNAYLVDISHLGNGLDKRNFAEFYKKYKVPDVGTHPSDFGFQNIANCLWTVFNAE